MKKKKGRRKKQDENIMVSPDHNYIKIEGKQQIFYILYHIMYKIFYEGKRSRPSRQKFFGRVGNGGYSLWYIGPSLSPASLIKLEIRHLLKTWKNVIFSKMSKISNIFKILLPVHFQHD